VGIENFPYKKVLLKISGEAFASDDNGGVDVSKAIDIAQRIVEFLEVGVSVGVVVGGGNILRGSSCVSKGIRRISADRMGMVSTVINGMMLREALINEGVKSVVFSSFDIGGGICKLYSSDAALAEMNKGAVVISVGGIGNPFFSTDTAGVLRALELTCDVMIKATHVDGVYSDDPVKCASAERYRILGYDQVMRERLMVMDTTAISLAYDNSMPLIVCSLFGSMKLWEVVMNRDYSTIIE